jgi:hypothetical protein
MSSDTTGGAVAEYLYELELRLSGLPVLQRRELLADLEAHITNERVDRAVSSEGELLEILERLGSPEVVAAAAYEEAGLLQPHATGRRLTPARPAPVLAYAGDVPRSLPPVPPPPDAPPFAGPFPPVGPSFAAPPPPFAEPAYAGGMPLGGSAPARPAEGSSTAKTVAIGAGIVLAVFILLGCLAGAFLVRGSSAEGGAVTEAPAVRIEPAEPPVPTLGN